MEDLNFWVTNIAAYVTLIEFIIKTVKKLRQGKPKSSKKKRKKKR